MQMENAPGLDPPGRSLGHIAWQRDQQEDTTARLGRRAFRALRHGEALGGDGSRSVAIRSFMVGAVNANWTFQHVVHAAFDPVNIGGAKVREIAQRRGNDRAMKYLRGEYDRAAAFVHRNALVLDRNGALLTIIEWTERVDGTVWKGAGGITDRNALYAFAEMAMHTGSATRVPMSGRTLAEVIGVTHQTAAKAVRRICERKWLRLAAQTDGPHPALYALTVPCEATATPSHTDSAREVSHLLHTSPSHDAWRWAGLGKGPHRIYDLVVQEISAAADIASILGVSRSAVHAHLRRLRDSGLVESDAGSWRVTGRSLDVVAAEWGTAGTGFEQRRRHQQQRDGWHGKRAQ